MPSPAAALLPTRLLTCILLHGSVASGCILQHLLQLLNGGAATAPGAPQLLALVPLACQHGRCCLQRSKLLLRFVALGTEHGSLLLRCLQLLPGGCGSPRVLQAGL